MNLKDLKIAISSYKSSYQVCARKLIHSLTDTNDFRHDQILLVVGGYECSEKFNFMGCEAVKVNHNSFDHTAVIEVIEGNYFSNYWFLTHDTCTMGENFQHFLNSFKVTKDYTSITEMGWLNMGICTQKFIDNNKSFILSLKDCSKIRAILSERTYTRLGDYDYLVPNYKSIRSIENQNIYDDNKKRTVLYFQDLDLYKYQSYEAVNIMKPNFTENKNEDLF